MTLAIDRNYAPVSTGSAAFRIFTMPKVGWAGAGRYRVARRTHDEFTEYELYNIPDWDGCGALPIASHTVQAARSFKRLFDRNVPLPDIAPGADGTIGFEWRILTPGYEAAVQIDIGPGGRVFARRVYPDGTVHSYQLTRVETGARQLLQELFPA